MDIIASDTFGRHVKLNHQSVKRVLSQPCNGMAHVFAHDPVLVIIHRTKDNGSWSISVEELYDDVTKTDKIIPIYHVEFEDAAIDAAIKLFMSLIKSQRKSFEKYMYSKLGKSVILGKLPRDSSQNYLYEILQQDVRRRAKRR